MKFEPLTGVRKPLASAKLRLAQLKHMASEFSVDLLGWGARRSDREPLRMLTTPVHQYGSDKEGSDVLIGAIFLFVQGVDPEAALVLEAHRQDDNQYRWEYALVPQTSGALEAKHKKNVIWTKAVNAPLLGHGYTSKPIPADARVR